jgi:hypothetical protein
MPIPIERELWSMDLQKAANIAQVLSLAPGGYCAYAAWVALHAQQQQALAPVTGAVLTPTPYVNSTALLIAFGAFVALLALAVALTVWSWTARRRVSSTVPVVEPPAPAHQTDEARMQILAAFYMKLTLLQEHVQQMIDLEQLTPDAPSTLNYYPYQVALDKLRRDLINLSPAILPTATAIDFQPPPSPKDYVATKDSLPSAIGDLMKKVRTHWHRYHGPVGPGR